jgi:hypothetical protein
MPYYCKDASIDSAKSSRIKFKCNEINVLDEIIDAFKENIPYYYWDSSTNTVLEKYSRSCVVAKLLLADNVQRLVFKWFKKI